MFLNGNVYYFASGRMLAIGLVMGPTHHYWYLWLDRYLKPTQVWSKILADQILAAPFFAFGFFYGMGLLEGRKVEECTAEFKSKFLAVYAVSSDALLQIGRLIMKFCFSV